MKKTIALFVAFITILSMSACRIEKVYNNKQPAQTYKLNLSNFDGIQNRSNCNIHFTQSNTYSVTLKASQQWYDTHRISVEDNTLKIESSNTKKEKGVSVISFKYDTGAELWVSAPSLALVRMLGSGDFAAESDLKGESLIIDIAGSGDSNLKGVSLTDDFNYRVAGSGDIKTGLIKAKNASFGIAGSGDISTGLENVGNTKINISGSGDANVNFNNCDSASVSVAGSGDMTLQGQLKSLDKHVSGSGDIDTSKLQIGK